MPAAPGLILTIHDASGTRTVTVRDTGATIGRGAECDVVLADPRRAISRLQARIDWRDGHYRLTDAGRNPTLVNGHVLGVWREAVLRDADTLSIDTCRIEIGIHGASAGDEPAVFAALPAVVADDDAAPHEDGFDAPTSVRVPERGTGEGAAKASHAIAQRAHEEAPRPDGDAFDVPTMVRMPDADAGRVPGVRAAEAVHAAGGRAGAAVRPARGAAYPAIDAPHEAALPSSAAADLNHAAGAADGAGAVDDADAATATATDADADADADATAPRTPSPASTRRTPAGHAAGTTRNDALLAALQDGLGIVPTTLAPRDAIAFAHRAGVLLRESIEGAMAMPNTPMAPNPLHDATSVEAALTLLLASTHAEASRTMLRDAFGVVREHRRALHDVLREVLVDLAPDVAPPSRPGWLGRWLTPRASRWSAHHEQAWARAAQRAAALLDVPAASLRADRADQATDSRPRST